MSSDSICKITWKNLMFPALSLIPVLGVWIAWKHIRRKNDPDIKATGVDETLPDAAIIYKYWLYGFTYSTLIALIGFMFSIVAPSFPEKILLGLTIWFSLSIWMFSLVSCHSFLVSKLFSKIFQKTFSMRHAVLVSVRTFSVVLIMTYVMSLISLPLETYSAFLIGALLVIIFAFLLCIAFFSIDIHSLLFKSKIRKMLYAGLGSAIAWVFSFVLITVLLIVLISIFISPA